jgi:hypothetical protein
VGVTLNEKDYLEQRLQNQIDWYDRRSGSAQTGYKSLRTLELVAAALIPLLSGYTAQWPVLTYAIGGLGLVVALVAGLLSLHRHQERWIEYRATAEALHREKFLFLTRAAPYDGPDAFARLVQTVEARLASENAAWTQYAARQGHQTSSDTAHQNPPA